MSQVRRGPSTVGALLVLCPVALLVWLIWPDPSGNSPPVRSEAADPALQRAEACANAPLAVLVASSSDEDWRVRAASYTAISKIQPFEFMPMRDTPVNKRETIVLGWLDRHDPKLSGDLCDVYAAAEHLRFGRPLIQRCLRCHVGDEPTPELSSERCAGCHETIHRQWTGTAHTNSLSHLNLITIDPATRQQVPFDFEGRKGMSCVACHQPDESVPLVDEDEPESLRCVATFQTLSCGTCHKQEQVEWKTWIKSPRYRKATWPPGATEADLSAPAGCIDCHMISSSHLWSARRDPDLLSGGITLDVTQDVQGRTGLVLQNLAGHAYPTGTTRRALELYAAVDGKPERLIAILAKSRPGQEGMSTVVEKPQPPLQPGELRYFALEGAQQSVSARLVYQRNRFQPGSYSTEVTATESNIHPHPSMGGHAESNGKPVPAE